MAPKYLQKIIDYKKKLVISKAPLLATLKETALKSEYTRYSLFKEQISKEGKFNLIAEIKKASPSKGLIREDFDYKEIAKVYQDNGVCAISVLTEDKYFLGNLRYLEQLSFDCNVPLLMKDFIIDESQIYEARHLGASALLLIVAILDDETIINFIKTAANLDLDCLVEVHNENELKRAINCGAEIIGVNNRNLETFEVDVTNSEKLIPQIPKGVVSVAESGIKTHEDIIRLKNVGANAVLIGETFMREDDIAEKMKEVMYG